MAKNDLPCHPPFILVRVSVACPRFVLSREGPYGQKPSGDWPCFGRLFIDFVLTGCSWTHFGRDIQIPYGRLMFFAGHIEQCMFV